MVWRLTIIADSAQFSAMVTELSDAGNVGAPLADAIGWRWTLAALAPGPFIGAAAMLLLRGRAGERAIAGGLR